MADHLSGTISIDELLKKIRAEISARTEELNHTTRNDEMLPPRLNETGIFRFVKRIQTKIRDYPFYHAVYRVASRFKKVIPVFHEEVDAAYLLKFSDKEFVERSYSIVLKRTPDKQSLDHFLMALRSGRLSKIEILGRLRYSREGREIGVRVRRLSLPFAVQTSYRIPVFGYGLRLVSAILTLPVILRDAQKREALDDMRFARLSALLAEREAERGTEDAKAGLEPPKAKTPGKDAS